MSSLRWQRRPVLRRPVMVVAFGGWNDAADAASTAVEYLVRTWSARVFAEIDPEDFFDFTVARPQIRLEDGLTRRIEWPAITLSAASVPGSQRDVVLLRGTEPALRWRHFSDAVVGVAAELGVEMVVGLGALLADIAHTRPVKVTGTAADPALVARLGLSRSRYEGPTGILGVLHEAFAAAGIPSVSLWASVPHYVAQSPSPKATLALVERTVGLLGVSLDAFDLKVATSAYERQVNEMVAADEDAVVYVAHLEQAGDDIIGDDDLLEPVSADELADEVSDYLRDHHGEP
ncbi:MAG: PAC2 family protein [Acidimicrobiales bacterium]